MVNVKVVGGGVVASIRVWWLGVLAGWCDDTMAVPRPA